MVCLGNICRSPMAQGILEHKANLANFPLEVNSCGTASYHIGEHPDARAVKTAKTHGIDIANYRGSQFSIADFDCYDRIYAMDYSNYENIIALSDNPQHQQKVDLILNLIYPEENMSVPDPYYGGESGFENVFQLLDKACEVLIHQLHEQQ
jgi:protein-tyrosine phosphatase